MHGDPFSGNVGRASWIVHGFCRKILEGTRFVNMLRQEDLFD